MSKEKEYEYIIDINKVSGKVCVPEEVLEELKKSIKGSFLRSMKNETVVCPIIGKSISFLYCYGKCSNFVRRVKGKLYCRGLPVQIDI
jgi:hypothetical protein